MESRKRVETVIERAIRILADPTDQGYTEERAVQVKKRNAQCSSTTMSMVIKKFEAFAQEFHEFSMPKATEAVQEFAQEYDTGIGPISYKLQLRDKKFVDLKLGEQNEVLQRIATFAWMEKMIGNEMVSIVACTGYYLRLPNKYFFFKQLTRVAIRGILSE